jgi:hypothetical protein
VNVASRMTPACATGAARLASGIRGATLAANYATTFAAYCARVPDSS